MYNVFENMSVFKISILSNVKKSWLACESFLRFRLMVIANELPELDV